MARSRPIASGASAASSPALDVLDGGGGGSPLDDADDALSPQEQIEQWQTAWTVAAQGFEDGLAKLAPQHPRRAEFARITLDARRAAGLPPAPALRRA